MTQPTAKQHFQVESGSYRPQPQSASPDPQSAVGRLVGLGSDRSVVSPNGSRHTPSRAIGTERPTRGGSVPRVAFVSTYPPTACGLASFTASLRDAMARNRGSGEGLGVVRVSDGAGLDGSSPDPVIATVDPADPHSMGEAARKLRGFDAVVLQHEYGIYGPDDGKAVVQLADLIRPQLVTTMHTVLAEPRPLQRWIVGRLARASARLVVPTQAARRILHERYQLDPELISVIPHGTHPIDAGRTDSAGRARPGAGTRPTLLTWGLLGPGKGLESALLAVATARRRLPDLRYVIAGRTHPKVASASGEAYRRGLEQMVGRLGLEDCVEFVDDYLPREALSALLGGTHAVVLPYESTEQVVSGVLVEAVAACVPTIATAFPHAVELAEEGAVAVVPHRDPEALAETIADLLSTPDIRERMVSAQGRLGPSLSWANVAAQYEELIGAVVRARPAMAS